MKVKDILTAKGKKVISIQEENTIFEALQSFHTHRVGSLIVLDLQHKIVGIISPRDILTAILRAPDKLKEIQVKEVMTRDLIVATPDDDLDYVEVTLTENRIRHLPVVEKQQLVGIISIGDVVKAQLKAVHAENHYLRDYIMDKYPA